MTVYFVLPTYAGNNMFSNVLLRILENEAIYCVKVSFLCGLFLSHNYS